MDNQAEPIVLVGGGGHCLSVIDVLNTIGWSVAGVVHGPEASAPAQTVAELPYLGRDDDLPELARHFSHALVTVGQIKSPQPRRSIYKQLKSLGFILPRPVSPLARVSQWAVLGEGSVVMHQALVNAEAEIGVNVIINSRALVEHGCRVGDHCHLAVGAILGGETVVGEGSFIGAGAIIRNNVTVGRGCIIGFGARVHRDVPDGAVYYG